MPLISVIVTCYNVSEYLEECLDSVVRQTLQDMEIIIVDDGSTDATREIIGRYESADPRIRSICFEENTIGGVGSAANAGLDAATGDFIGFVDGDDYLELDMFEKLCRAAIDGQSDLAMCRYLEVREGTGETRQPAERGRWAGIGDQRTVQLDSPERVIEILGFISVPWRKVYSRALLEGEGIRFPVVDYFWEDNPFHWFTVCSARSISLVPEVLYHHRIGRAGQTMVARSPDFVKLFGHYETIRIWLSQRGLLDAYEGALLSWVLSQYEWIVARVPRESGEELYQALRSVVLSGDEDRLERALGLRLRGTGKAMRRVRRGEKEPFLDDFERRYDGETSGIREARARMERGLATIALAKENLRTYGVRNTLSKILMRYGFDAGTLSPGKRVRDRAITEEQMVKLLAVLQRDIDKKHLELIGRIEDLERNLKDATPKRRE